MGLGRVFSEDGHMKLSVLPAPSGSHKRWSRHSKGIFNRKHRILDIYCTPYHFGFGLISVEEVIVQRFFYKTHSRRNGCQCSTYPEEFKYEIWWLDFVKVHPINKLCDRNKAAWVVRLLHVNVEAWPVQVVPTPIDKFVPADDHCMQGLQIRLQFSARKNPGVPVRRPYRDCKSKKCTTSLRPSSVDIRKNSSEFFPSNKPYEPQGKGDSANRDKRQPHRPIQNLTHRSIPKTCVCANCATRRLSC